MKFLPRFLSFNLSIASLTATIFGLVGCMSLTSQQDFDRTQAAKARIELALGYLAQKDIQLTKQNLDKAMQYAPDYYLTHSALAYFYQQQNEVELARKSYLKAISLDTSQGDVHNNYAVFLCQQQQFEQAYQQFDLAIQSPNYYQLAQSYENKLLCAEAANNSLVYQQALAALQKIDKPRAQKYLSIPNE